MPGGRELIGVSMSPPSLPDSGLDPVRIAHTSVVAAVLDRALSGGDLSRDEAALVIECPDEDVAAVCAAATGAPSPTCARWPRWCSARPPFGLISIPAR